MNGRSNFGAIFSVCYWKVPSVKISKYQTLEILHKTTTVAVHLFCGDKKQYQYINHIYIYLKLDSSAGTFARPTLWNFRWIYFRAIQGWLLLHIYFEKVFHCFHKNISQNTLNELTVFISLIRPKLKAL